MPRFSYRALTPHGEIQQSVLDAESPSAAIQRLYSRKLTPLRVRRHFLPHLSLTLHPLSNATLSLWCTQLSALLTAGIALDEALDELQPDSPTTHPALAGLGHLLREGKSLSDALTEQANSLDTRWIRLLAAGERAGHLAQTLLQLGQHLAWENQERSQTRQSLIQPMISAFSVLLAVIFLVIYLTPQLRPLFPTDALPWSTRILFWLTDFLGANGQFVLWGCLVSLLIVWLCYQRSPRVRFIIDRLRVHVVLIGPLHFQGQFARYVQTWGLLYQNGIPMLEAMQDSGQTLHNSAIQQQLEEAEKRIASGMHVAMAFAEAHQLRWPTPTLRMLKQGEKTGELATALVDLAKQLQLRHQQTTQKINSLLQPTVTVSSGVLLAWVATALLGPLYGQFSHALP